MASDLNNINAPKRDQPTWRPTDPPSAKKLNTLSRGVSGLLQQNMPGRDVSNSGYRFPNILVVKIVTIFADYIVTRAIEVPDGPILSTETETPPTVINEAGEGVAGTPVPTDDTDSLGQYFVAKPPLFRRDIYNNRVRNGITLEWNDAILDGGERTAIDKGVIFDPDTGAEDTSDDVEEIQVITPSYQVGDVLYIMGGINGTGGGSGLVTQVEGENQAILWLDMNVDGRAWARKKSQALGADE